MVVLGALTLGLGAMMTGLYLTLLMTVIIGVVVGLNNGPVWLAMALGGMSGFVLPRFCESVGLP